MQPVDLVFTVTGLLSDSYLSAEEQHSSINNGFKRKMCVLLFMRPHVIHGSLLIMRLENRTIYDFFLRYPAASLTASRDLQEPTAFSAITVHLS